MPFHTSPRKQWAEPPTCVLLFSLCEPSPPISPTLPLQDHYTLSCHHPGPALGKCQVKWSLPFNSQAHPAPALPVLLLVTSNAGILGLRKDPLSAGGLPWGGESPLSSDAWASPTGSCIFCYCLSGVPGGSTPEWPNVYSASCKQK